MTIYQALLGAKNKLKQKSISSSALDAEILLAHALRKPREFVIAHPEKNLKAAEQKNYSILIARRARFEPVAYLTGIKEFYGLTIRTDSRALIPRPETELLVDEAIARAALLGQKITIIDIGTGSGAIALALAKSLPNASILALEASADALRLARINAKALKLEIKPIHSNLLSGLKLEHIAGAILVANLPYLAKGETKGFPNEIKLGLKFEPQDALYANRNGTALYAELFQQIANLKASPDSLIAEIGSHNWRDFSDLAKRHFPKSKITVKKDLSRRPRILIIDFK